MKAFVFSIGEPTTDLAVWSLERLGFFVRLLHDPKTTFWQKYMEFIDMTRNDDVVVRCDADVVTTKEFLQLYSFYKSQKDLWWVKGQVYCHLKHNMVVGGANIMNNQVIQTGVQHLFEFKNDSRPETALSRCKELYNPRRYLATNFFTGIHGYKQRDEDIKRVMKQKEERDQMKNWDVELIEKLGKI